MTSFFSKCPKCGVMVVKGNPCPQCGPERPASSDEARTDIPGGPGPAPGATLAEEYQHRYDRHVRNYTIYMLLMAGTGVVGILTALCWFMFIFMGSVGAALSLIPLNIGLLVLGFIVKGGRSLFPVEIFCPSCNTRIDELGLNMGACPGCNVRLR